jgi:GT2 family glycosyltransferase
MVRSRTYTILECGASGIVRMARAFRMAPSVSVSAIVPARNEAATIARAVRALAAQPEITEIIVANDQSTDATGEILAALAGELPQLRVIEIDELPPGWVGKNHACARAAAEARGAWLLFTDADAELLAGAVARAVSDAAAAGAALVSYSPEQETGGFWERALVPFVFTRLASRYPYAAVCDPETEIAAANGQFLMMRREAYLVLGGHASVAGEILEDVALARRAKQSGLRLHFAPGAGIARTRMYAGFREMWEGWTKNLYPLVGGTRGALVRELVAVVPWIPLVMLALGLVHPVFALLGGLLLAGRHAAYAAMLRRNRMPRSRIVYYLPAVLLYGAALAASARRYRRGRVAWKGREYPVGEQWR